VSESEAAPDPGAAASRSDGPAAAGPLTFRWAEEVVIGALSHLLDQHPWAKDRLGMHAGRVVVLSAQLPSPFDQAMPPIRLQVSAEGGFAAAEPGQQAAVTMCLRPSIDAGFDLLSHGPVGLQRHLSIDGDVMLAATMAELAQGLRWDWEDDLSRLVGDVAAHRTGRAVREAGHGLREFSERLLRMFAGQVEDAQAPVVGVGEWAIHRDALTAIELRIQSLEARALRAS
jgi:ubiquinone biosynthesis protein UbiJ